LHLATERALGILVREVTDDVVDHALAGSGLRGPAGRLQVDVGLGDAEASPDLLGVGERVLPRAGVDDLAGAAPVGTGVDLPLDLARFLVDGTADDDAGSVLDIVGGVRPVGGR